MSTNKENFVLTEVQRIEMKEIDGSNEVRYSALVNGKFRIHFVTDGIFLRKHMSMEEWIEYAKQAVKRQIK